MTDFVYLWKQTKKQTGANKRHKDLEEIKKQKSEMKTKQAELRKNMDENNKTE